jgi:hypothetical protein
MSKFLKQFGMKEGHGMMYSKTAAKDDVIYDDADPSIKGKLVDKTAEGFLIQKDDGTTTTVPFDRVVFEEPVAKDTENVPDDMAKAVDRVITYDGTKVGVGKRFRSIFEKVLGKTDLSTSDYQAQVDGMQRLVYRIAKDPDPIARFKEETDKIRKALNPEGKSLTEAELNPIKQFITQISQEVSMNRGYISAKEGLVRFQEVNGSTRDLEGRLVETRGTPSMLQQMYGQDSVFFATHFADSLDRGITKTLVDLEPAQLRTALEAGNRDGFEFYSYIADKGIAVYVKQHPSLGSMERVMGEWNRVKDVFPDLEAVLTADAKLSGTSLEQTKRRWLNNVLIW